ncbi:MULTISPECIES: HAD family hydrolase [Actinoalloteichus]|uniref:HAD superfamily hydrolase n=1 Tax=Actinoalloteichus fjordicus TaxID=1612552 RepID=A0AAC9LBR6_9PSEU|nr:MULTISPECIES: HAD family hydrolase [Actinoalloteichus]APU15033.1 putative HAD superfamily hydrolase [Actinoalloteichus fjordicus]APU21101.1 putative HAD superfamily hydrolase [Actinoalloteichus sp. GBA129-24]
MSFDAVLFDWRGTLVTTLAEPDWVRRALESIGRHAGPEQIETVLAAIRTVDHDGRRLDAPGVDADADRHRQTYLGVFAEAGLDPELARSLYAVESDTRHNPFASDVSEVLRSLHTAGVRIAVVSDIHFDLRPVFADAGLAGLVDVFTLSFEQGVQKPDRAMFDRTVTALGVDAADALMVGDRSGPDGAAIESGLTTLLLPPLRSTDDRRLHRVLALCLPR